MIEVNEIFQVDFFKEVLNECEKIAYRTLSKLEDKGIDERMIRVAFLENQQTQTNRDSCYYYLSNIKTMMINSKY